MGACLKKHKDHDPAPVPACPDKRHPKGVKGPNHQPPQQHNVETAEKPQEKTGKDKKNLCKQKENREQKFSQKKLEQTFNHFVDESEENGSDQFIGPQGIETLCLELEVDPEDVVMLVLAFHLNAKEMGYFTRHEFVEGLKKMNIDCAAKLRDHLPVLRKELQDDNKFKDIYRFAFGFTKEADQKCIELDMALGMINLLLTKRYPITTDFVTFLRSDAHTCRGLNADQWASLLEFCKTIKPDFSNYDENGAWPCILDEFVEWATKRKDRGSDSGEEQEA